MQIEFFVVNVLLSLLIVTLAVIYLRNPTRKVIRELCFSDAAAEFWLKSADILAYSGAMILVLMFGEFDAANGLESMRTTLLLTLAGLFFVVIFVARNIWNSVLASGTREA